MLLDQRQAIDLMRYPSLPILPHLPSVLFRILFSVTVLVSVFLICVFHFYQKRIGLQPHQQDAVKIRSTVSKCVTFSAFISRCGCAKILELLIE